MWDRVFADLIRDRDNQYLMIESTLVRAHQQAATGKRGATQALGRSRGGPTTKIHMAADTFGRPIRFIIPAGQNGDAPADPDLLEGFRPKPVLAHKAYDSNAPHSIISNLGAEAVIQSNRTRKALIAHDIAAYRARNCIERCFSKLEHFRRFATR